MPSRHEEPISLRRGPFTLFVRHRDSVRLVTALMSLIPKRILSSLTTGCFALLGFRILHAPTNRRALENCVGGLAEGYCDPKEIGSSHTGAHYISGKRRRGLVHPNHSDA